MSEAGSMSEEELEPVPVPANETLGNGTRRAHGTPAPTSYHRLPATTETPLATPPSSPSLAIARTADSRLMFFQSLHKA